MLFNLYIYIYIYVLKLRLSLFRLLYYTLFYFEFLLIIYSFLFFFFSLQSIWWYGARNLFLEICFGDENYPRSTSRKNISLFFCEIVVAFWYRLFVIDRVQNEFFFKPFVTNNHVLYPFIDIQSPVSISIKIQTRYHSRTIDNLSFVCFSIFFFFFLSSIDHNEYNTICKLTLTNDMRLMNIFNERSKVTIRSLLNGLYNAMVSHFSTICSIKYN